MNLRKEIVLVAGVVVTAAEAGATALPPGQMRNVAQAAVPLLIALGVRPRVSPLSPLSRPAVGRIVAALAALTGRATLTGPVAVDLLDSLPEMLSGPIDLPEGIAAPAKPMTPFEGEAPLTPLPFDTSSPHHAPQEQTA